MEVELTPRVSHGVEQIVHPFVAQHVRERRVGTQHSTVERNTKYSFERIFDSVAVLLFAAAHCVFGPLALGDVGGDAANGIGPAVAVIERKLDREEGVHLVIVERNQFLRLDSRPRRQHLLVDGLKRGCVFCGEDVVVRLAHDLAARDVKQLLVAAIHQDVAPLQVLHVDDRGQFVDDRLQARVTGLGDRRPEPLGHLVELVGQQVQFMAATVLEDEDLVAQVVDLQLPNELDQLPQRPAQPALNDEQKDEPESERLDDRIDEDQEEAVFDLLDDDLLAGIDGPGADRAATAVFVGVDDREGPAEHLAEQARALLHRRKASGLIRLQLPAVLILDDARRPHDLALGVLDLDADHDGQILHAGQDAPQHVIVEVPHRVGDAGTESLLHRLDFVQQALFGVAVLGHELDAGDDHRHDEVAAEDDLQQARGDRVDQRWRPVAVTPALTGPGHRTRPRAISPSSARRCRRSFESAGRCLHRTTPR